MMHRCQYAFDLKKDCYSLEYMVRMVYFLKFRQGTVAAMERNARNVVGAYLNRAMIYGKN